MATILTLFPASPSAPPAAAGRDVWPYGAAIGHPMAGDVREFLELLAAFGVSENTIRHYGHDLALFLRFLERHKANVVDASQIRPDTVREFLSYLSHARGNSKSSVRRRLAAVRKFMRYLHEMGATPFDPTAHLALTTKRKGLPTVLTREEALRLLEASKMSRFPARDHAIFRLFLTCGCTLSELLHLRLPDYNALEGTITFSGGRQRPRTLPLPEACRRALDCYLEERPRVRVGRRIFLNRRAEPITKGAVYHAFRLALRRAGIEKQGLTVHSLRHTCLALLWQAGMSLHVLQEVAGHHSLATTREYAWAGPRLRGSAAGARRAQHPLDEPPPEA